MEETDTYFFPCDIHTLEDELGDIHRAELECPGVYYVACTNPGYPYPREYYVLDMASDVISKRAKTYGQCMKYHAGLSLIDFEQPCGGHLVVTYEIQRYKTLQGVPLPEEDSLLAMAVYGMEDYPEYFGPFPAPSVTPHGVTARYQTLINGIFLLETETAERMISVCYPIWASSLSKYAVRLAEQTEYDRRRGIHITFGSLYFTPETGSVALFELLRAGELPVLERLNIPALHNALWQDHPQYVICHNRRELNGENDVAMRFLQSLGCEEAEYESDTRDFITMSPEAGTVYLKW